MKRSHLFLAVAATLLVLGSSSKAHAWGAVHVGYTQVGSAGVQHYGRTVAVGPNGVYSGAHVSGVGYGGVYRAGYVGGVGYTGVSYGVTNVYTPYYYNPYYSGAYSVGTYNYGVYNYSAGVYHGY
jgi:hypothetical protein